MGDKDFALVTKRTFSFVYQLPRLSRSYYGNVRFYYSNENYKFPFFFLKVSQLKSNHNPPPYEV